MTEYGVQICEMFLVGNRLTKITTGNVTLNYTYDNANRLSRVEGVSYTWDNNGNLLNDGVSTYTYDHSNQLTGVSQGGTNYSYVYNGLGNRLRQTVGASTTNYVFDSSSGLSQVLADGTNTYLYGIDRISQSYTGGKDYFFSDALGSVRQLANTSGGISLSRNYEPYGTVYGAMGNESTAYGFTSEWTDGTGLVNLRARYYDPVSGRFVSRDSWAGDYSNPITLTKWVYANGNPMRYVDPSGNCYTDKNIFSRGYWDRFFESPILGPCRSNSGNSISVCIAPTTLPSPTSTNTPTSTPTSTPTLTPTPSPTITPLSLNDPELIISTILERFGVEMVNSETRNWEFGNLNTAFTALSMIDNRINGKLKTILTGKKFTITDGGNKYYGWATLSGVTFHTYSSVTKIPLINFLHETGHMIDYSKNNGYSNPLKITPTWVKDGYVNRELLGDMFRQPVQALPMGEAYQPTEYWADAFGNFAADNILLKGQERTGNGQKMYDYVYGALNH